MAGDSARILFDDLGTGSGRIVFGGDGFSEALVETQVSAALPGPGVAVSVTKVVAVEIAFALAGPGLALNAVYHSNTSRPIAHSFKSQFEEGSRADAIVTSSNDETQQADAIFESKGQEAAPLGALVFGQNEEDIRLGAQFGIELQEGIRLPGVQAAVEWQEDIRLGLLKTAKLQEAVRTVQHQRRFAWQECIRVGAIRTSKLQPAAPLKKSWGSSLHYGRNVNKSITSTYKGDMVPPPGTRQIIVVPPHDPCYIADGRIIFDPPWTGSGRIVLFCERHSDVPLPPAVIVIPIKKVYIVQNSATLIRVDGGAVIKTYSLSLTLDVNSWTWGFSASVDITSAGALAPNSFGDPVILQATINGTDIMLVVDSKGSSREFGGGTIRISGRGLNSLLDNDATMYFNNLSDDLTINQLMTQALTDNGVSIGWDVDFRLTDWLVPAGAWSHTGNYKSALGALAAAGGGYLQPHDTEQSVIVLPRYPSAPWDWAGLTPDFEIPVNVASVEGIEFIRKPKYNRVFVEGSAVGGRRGQVTRLGADGAILAPSVVDPLLTHADGLRQRGLSILADTGNQALVTVTLPVLPETGIIRPGNTVRYVDEVGPRFGIVRSASVSVGMPEIWQTIGVETHAAD